MNAISTNTNYEKCPHCQGENVVTTQHGPGSSWDDEYTYKCAFCGKRLGSCKAFAKPEVSKRKTVRDL